MQADQLLLQTSGNFPKFSTLDRKNSAYHKQRHYKPLKYLYVSNHLLSKMIGTILPESIKHQKENVPNINWSTTLILGGGHTLPPPPNLFTGGMPSPFLRHCSDCLQVISNTYPWMFSVSFFSSWLYQGEVVRLVRAEWFYLRVAPRGGGRAHLDSAGPRGVGERRLGLLRPGGTRDQRPYRGGPWLLCY